MKRTIISVISVIMIAILIFSVSSVLAAKPQDVIERSNGFPSGQHFNLNIHGKKDGFIGNSTSGGNSVFIPEYGESTIQYVSNKKASLTELMVLDPLAESFDGDPAKVQLPYKIVTDDGSIIPAEGYYVLARIKGKPNNGKECLDGDCPSQVILEPNIVIQACNDAGDPDFPGYTDCLLALGLIVGNNLYEADDEVFVRFDPTVVKGKGKSKGKDITSLFTWTGWVYDAVLDISGPGGVPDGVIDAYDVPITPEWDNNPTDGSINEDEFNAWRDAMAALDPPLAQYFDEEWIFNIADLVVTEQPVDNDGTKLLKVRFYPVATTEYTPV
jgi:hypothetical protein